MNNYLKIGLVLISLLSVITSCKTPSNTARTPSKQFPSNFSQIEDSLNIANLSWKNYFTDSFLIDLIDTALVNNQELNITLQEIEIAKNEVKARKGEYLPSIGIGAGAGVEKTARYTPFGANEATTDIVPGREMPEPVPDLMIGAQASWELDIWGKLRNSKKSAVFKYLASQEGRNFMLTNLVSEIANTYYELLALDNQLEIVRQNINIQNNALRIVRQQKLAGKVTELAVKRFEAEVLKNKSSIYYIEQSIYEKENKINFLLGRYPQNISRTPVEIIKLKKDSIYPGLPSQLLSNRPDVRKAEMELEAANLDIKVARAKFYPTLGITAGIGLNAFDPTYFLKTPGALAYSFAGDLFAPLINRNAIKANFNMATAKQIQAIYNYELTVLNAYVEVSNQLSEIKNLQLSYDLKEQEVNTLNKSIDISNDLFKSARADYMEILLTQRDALESKFDLIETKMEQMHARVNIYRSLGGGWK